MGSSPTPVILLIFLKKVSFPLFWTPAQGVIYHYPCYWPQKIQARWPCGPRCLHSTPVNLLIFLYKVFFPVFWTPAHDIYYHHKCYWPLNKQAEWPIVVRHWLKAPCTLIKWVRVPLKSFFWHSYTKYYFLYFEHLKMVSNTIMNSIDNKTYRQDGRLV